MVVGTLQDRTECLSTEAIHVAVSDVKGIDHSVRLEDRHEDHEVLATDIVLTNVQLQDAVGI